MNYDLVGPSQLVVVQLAVSALEIRTEPLWMHNINKAYW